MTTISVEASARTDDRGTVSTANRRAFYIALLAVLAAVFSRVLVQLGAPGALNFVHFPLAVLAAGLVERRHRDTNVGFLGMLLFLGFGFVSGLTNGVGPLRILLTWLVWVEPLLIAYVVWTTVREARGRERVLLRRHATWAIGATIGAQFLFMTAQIPNRSLGPDEMQGTFLGSGTGAHVAPALALVGSMLLVGSAIQTRRFRLAGAALAIYGFLLALLGAARAVSVTALAAFGAAAVILYLTEGSKRNLRTALFIILAGLVLIALGRPLFGTVPQADRLTVGLDIKLIGIERILEDMSRDPAVLVAGHGPGTTLSRVALETPQARLNPSSAIAALGFETTRFTAEVSQQSGASPIGRSSLFAPWSSFIGLLGDVGVVGLLIYLTLWVPVVRAALTRAPDARLALLSIVVMAGLLGVQQIYLEDPGFILPMAAILGLAAGSGWMGVPDDV